MRGHGEVPVRCEHLTGHVDTNYWKSFAQERLETAMGDPGSLSIFGRKPAQHRLFAEHVVAEYRAPTEGGTAAIRG